MRHNDIIANHHNLRKYIDLMDRQELIQAISWFPEIRNGVFSQHALLSGCDGGNGVYSFFTAFFFGSRRLAKFLWRNLGRKRSQLCDRSSGSLASSRLIISVCGGEKNNVFENQLDSRLCVSSSSCTPSAPGGANLCIHTQRGRFSVTRSRTRMENIFMGHELEHFSSTIAFSQQLPLYYRWDGCSSSCPSPLCVPEGTRHKNTSKIKLCYHKKKNTVFWIFFLPEPRNKNRNVTVMKMPANVKCYSNGKVCFSYPANVAKTQNQIKDQKPK